ncbi:MAG TPA: hypothetical protein VL096_13110 [Pirellulaceae bacterium]|nr:hypothetical protein [Pirellulaceae bacterium]
MQSRSTNKGKSAALDASNGFVNGAPVAANPKAAADNIGQDNVSSMQAFQGSRLLHAAGKYFGCLGDELICTNAAKWEN